MAAGDAQHLTVEPLGPGRYEVSGGSAPHLVTIDQHAASCDCASYTYRRRCKHLAAVTAYLQLAPIAPRQAAGPGLQRDVPLPDEPPEDRPA